MKIGLRTPSLKKSFKARTTGKMKRAMKSTYDPTYGKKGVGLVKDPKKAVYNKVYNKTTVGVSDIVKNDRPNNHKTNIHSSERLTYPTPQEKHDGLVQAGNMRIKVSTAKLIKNISLALAILIFFTAIATDTLWFSVFGFIFVGYYIYYNNQIKKALKKQKESS